MYGQKIIGGLVAVVVSVASVLLVALAAAPVAAAKDGCSSDFLGMPAWYDGLTVSGKDASGSSCTIMNPEEYKGGIGGFIWRIVLNVIQAFMMIVAYASVIMIIVGGFKYMTATGEPSKIAGAKKTIMNAVIGLVIALSAVAIVNLVKVAVS